MRTTIHLVMRACLIALGLAVSSGAAMVDSSLKLSNLRIKPTSGTVSFELPLTTSATTHALNSLGQEAFDGNGTSISSDVTANAVVSFA